MSDRTGVVGFRINIGPAWPWYTGGADADAAGGFCDARYISTHIQSGLPGGLSSP